MVETPQKIKIDSKDQVKGFYTLLTNGSVVCLPDNEYIVPEYILPELMKRGVKFKIEEREKENGSKTKSRIPDTSEIQ